MKNIKISHKATLCILCLLNLFCGFSQIDFNQEEQKELLDQVAKEIWLQVPQGTARGSNTIAIMQIPNTQTFVIGSNNANQATNVITTRSLVIKELQDRGFEVNKLIYIKGYGNVVTSEPYGAGDLLFPEIFAYACPLSERLTNANEMLSIHAEMSLIAFLGIYTNFNLLNNNAQDIVIGVDKPYCARCFSFLYHSGIYTMEPEMFNSTNIKIPVDNSKYWAAPYYTRSVNSFITSPYPGINVINPGPWPDWIIQTTADYFYNGTLYFGNQVNNDGSGHGIYEAPSIYNKIPAIPVYDYLLQVYGE